MKSTFKSRFKGNSIPDELERLGSILRAREEHSIPLGGRVLQPITATVTTSKGDDYTGHVIQSGNGQIEIRLRPGARITLPAQLLAELSHDFKPLPTLAPGQREDMLAPVA